MNEEKELTHIDLFSGIGGFTLAGEWAGFRTVVFCEKEEFCQKVLKARFGAVIADSSSIGLYHEKDKQKLEEKRGGKFHPIESRDIPTIANSKHSRKLQSKGGKRTQRKRISDIPLIPEIRDFDGTKWRGATLLTGGFPCQPFSHAGKQKGKEDDRYLWPQMLRVIKEAKPHWILAENVPGIFRMALDTVLSDLEGEGCTTGTFIIPACGLNAPHRRNRVWIIANSIGTGTRNQDGKIDDQERQIGQDRREGIRQEDGAIGTGRTTSANSHAPDSEGRNAREQKTRNRGQGFERGNWQEDWYEVAARFCRVDDGISDRVHRLKALGNAIVPQIAHEILKNIAWIERA